MDAHALLLINAQEERLLPVELKVGMLMEQAAMRMRASAMVGERISKLDDVIRVRALLAIIREKTRGTPRQSEACATPSTGNSSSSSSSSSSSREGEGDLPTAAGASLPNEEDFEMYQRMAVSAMKFVLYQLVDEGEKDNAKDVFDAYEGLLTTEELALAAAKGFPTLDVDNLMAPSHHCYRKLVAARHRFLLRKLGVLLDMTVGLDTLLGLATDTEALQESLAEIDLTAPEDDVERASESPEDCDVAASPSQAAAALAPLVVAKQMSTLRNTSWDREPGNDDTTEGETDEETPPQVLHVAEVSPSH